MAEEKRVPRVIVDSTAFHKLPLGAADGFVLSRIDGRVSERELAALTGLPDMQIRTSIDKLLGLKVIAFGPPVLPGAGSSPALPPAADSSAKLEGGASVRNPLLEEALAKITDETSELKEQADLAVDIRRRVLGLHSVIHALDHYAILGVARDADKKAVKKAYFEAAAVFHPDRYFRKNLGSFKPKMETVFGKVSAAYEVLTDKEKRAEYDAYLGDVEKSRAVEAMLRDVMVEVENAEREAVAAAGSAPAGESAARAPAPAPLSAAAEQRRREALAARLRGGRPMPSKPAASAPASPPPAAPRGNPQEAVDALKRRYEEKVEAARRAQGQKYYKLGETAEGRNDLTAAAASYRVALTFLRQDDPAYAHAMDIIAKSEAQLGEAYVRQADHEEKANRWEDASRSWERAVKFRPADHRAYERLANALVRSNGDLHAAAQFAQKAVQLAPMVGDYRCTLASVYIAANLMLNARRELETAAQQFPDNPNIPILLKKVAPKPT